MGLGRSQLIHRRVAHDKKYSLWIYAWFMIGQFIELVDYAMSSATLVKFFIGLAPALDEQVSGWGKGKT